MRWNVIRGKDGQVLAGASLEPDEGLVPEAVLEEGQTEEVLEVRRLDLVDNLDQTLARLGPRQGTAS